MLNVYCLFKICIFSFSQTFSLFKNDKRIGGSEKQLINSVWSKGIVYLVSALNIVPKILIRLSQYSGQMKFTFSHTYCVHHIT